MREDLTQFSFINSVVYLVYLSILYENVGQGKAATDSYKDPEIIAFDLLTNMKFKYSAHLIKTELPPEIWDIRQSYRTDLEYSIEIGQKHRIEIQDRNRNIKTQDRFASGNIGQRAKFGDLTLPEKEIVILCMGWSIQWNPYQTNQQSVSSTKHIERYIFKVVVFNGYTSSYITTYPLILIDQFYHRTIFIYSDQFNNCLVF